MGKYKEAGLLPQRAIAILEQLLVLRSLNPVRKDPTPVAMDRRRSSPNPGLGPSVELRGRHPPGQIDLAWVGKTLPSEGIAAEEPPPTLLQIQPTRTFGDKHLLEPGMLCHPGTRLQTVVATEVVRDDEDIARGIVRFDQFEQLDVVR